MFLHTYELDWFAHHVEQLIPELREHPLFLATLRGHWLGSSSVSAHGDTDLAGAEGVPSDASFVVTSDPDDLKSDLPGVAREIERTMEQHPWQRVDLGATVPTTSFDGCTVAAALLALRGYRRAGR